MSKIRQNPWAGLASYKDPEEEKTKGTEPLLFCGRDNESYDVAQLIENNIFVTLYGKSGTGKTSLLNAGVFPRLRKKQYIPISIRLGIEAIDMTFQECIEIKLRKAFETYGAVSTIDIVSIPVDNQSVEYLWSLFARTRFTDVDGHVLFPILVLDQFEEVFRHRRKDAEALLRQIHFMMDESHALDDRVINGQTYSYDFNYRFVISIREDDLYRLEDSIDNNYLADMKRCRFRLRNLSENGAKDVILIPGEGLLQVDDRHSIANTIIEMARNNEDNSVSANILSLICSRIFVEYQRAGIPNISISLVDKFVRGNLFEQFYNEATRGFSNREKSYIETNLVDSIGRRNSIPESDFLLHVKNGEVLFDGNRKILQRISTSSDGGHCRVELIHDSFCEPLTGMKEKRERLKRIKWLSIAIIVSFLSIADVLYLLYQKHQLEQSYEAKVNAEKRLNEKTKELDLLKEQIKDGNQRTIMFLDGEGFSVDGITFSTEYPTPTQLSEWKEKYFAICRSKIEEKRDDFNIPYDMVIHDPCLIYLVLISKSIDSKEEKQSWFDIYTLMTQEQIDQLYDILYRETYKLAQIDHEYAKDKEKRKKKFNAQ